MIRSVGVFAASSDAVGAEYRDAAERLGALLAERGLALVYGAGKVGLMGVLARAVREGGGRVIGVIPEKLRDLELAYLGADELIVTQDLRERKLVMEERADAFIAMPGGFGTLDEVIEVLVGRQLWYHEKPLVFLNINGIYDKLIGFFEDLIGGRFIPASHRELYHVCASPEEAMLFLDSYEPVAPHGKWF